MGPMIAELRRRTFRFARLGRAYKYIVAFAAAQFLAAILLILMRSALRPTIWLGIPGGSAIAPPVLGLCYFLIITGLTNVLYAAIYVQRRIRMALLGAYSCVLAFPIALGQSIEISLAVLAFVAGVWALVYTFHARFEGVHGPAGRSHFHAAAFFTLFGIVSAAELFPLFGLGGTPVAASILNLQFSALTIFVVPALLLAGVDLMQMSRAAGDWTSSAIARRRIPASVYTIALAAAVLLFVPRFLTHHSPLWILAQIALFLAIAALAGFLLRQSRAVLSAARTRVATSAIAICALVMLLLTLVPIPVIVVLQAVHPVYVAQEFSIRYPAGWSRDAVQFTESAALVHAYAFRSLEGNARFDVVLRSGSKRIDPLPYPRNAGEHHAAWTVADGQDRWDLFAFAPAGGFSAYAASFESMRSGFRPGSGQANPYYLQCQAYMTLAGIIALFLLAALRKKMSAVGLFAVLVTAAWTFSHSSFFVVLLHMPESLAPVFDMYEVELFAAAASLLVMAWLRLRGSRAAGNAAVLLLGLNISLVLAGALYGLYGASTGASERTALAAAVVIFAALAWDSAMSGEITNGHSAAFPAPGRICLFFGYVVLVVGVVLFFASVRFGTHGNVIDPFQTELYPQRGILLIGVPLILTLFSMRFVRLLREA